jgi:SAM-dependent methyltransferase
MSEPRLLDFNVDVPVESVAVGEAAMALTRDMIAADTFGIVNGFVTAHALNTLGNAPFLTDLQNDGQLDPNAIVEKYKLQRRHVIGLLRFLVTQDLFKEELGEVFRPTPKGLAALSGASLGWIRMIVSGYGNLMADAGKLMSGEHVYGKTITRRPLDVSLGSTMVSRSILDEVPFRIAERNGCKTIADLGCGTGAFLINWAQRNPAYAGVGVDIAPEAIDAANGYARAAGVAERVKFVCADGGDMSKVQPACRDVDMIYSFALEHELLARGDQFVIDHLDHLGELFPGKRYLVGEPSLNMTHQDGQFYWVHVLSHQGFPKNVVGWCEFFKRLDKAKLARVYLPEHQRIGMYFDLHLGQSGPANRPG